MGFFSQFLWPVIVAIIFAIGAPSRSSAQIQSNCGGRVVAFDFKGRIDGIPYESVVPPGDQANFIQKFCVEIAKIENWFADHQWLPSLITARQALGTYAPQQIFELNDVDLQVSISDEYDISRALVPASVGRRGAMEFPASEVPAPLNSAILHELSHVYFPNGDRFLAEGFAVYLQNKIGGNPAFPDFQTDLHDLARKIACSLDPTQSTDPNVGLAQISLAELDKIATPAPLETYGPDRKTQVLFSDETYPVAGSFVRFLIDTYGLDSFHKLFLMTPLKPLHRDGGTPDRWTSVYGLSIRDLEKQWKMLIAASPCPASPT